MKRPVLLITVLLIAVVSVYFLKCKGDDRPAEETAKQGPLALSENTDAFNLSFEKMLNAYTRLKDAFVAGDTVKANAAAADLVSASDSLKVNEIAGDSTGIIRETAGNYSGTITGWSKGLIGETSLEEKRKQFEMISDALWSLTRTVKYAGGKLYYQFCPMAFNNKGAYWISRNREIKNPYFGEKMLTCGSVEDSLDYSKK